MAQQQLSRIIEDDMKNKDPRFLQEIGDSVFKNDVLIEHRCTQMHTDRHRWIMGVR